MSKELWAPTGLVYLLSEWDLVALEKTPQPLQEFTNYLHGVISSIKLRLASLFPAHAHVPPHWQLVQLYFTLKSHKISMEQLQIEGSLEGIPWL